MATRRLPMRRIREVLRLKWVHRLSHRDTARSVGVSAGVVGSILARARKHELDWDAVEQLDDEALEVVLYGPKRGPGQQRPLPDPTWMHRELRRPGVTLELLHLEYLEKHPGGYRYTAFCDHYRRWLKRRGLSMRQTYKAGDKAFVDYSGKRPELVDRDTGEVTPVELFVAVLGASNLTYAEATLSQRGPDFIESHNRAFAYFGGLPALVVSDQLRSGVSAPCRYEPGIQRAYAEWARHYGTALMPARPRKPRDKAKVEAAVLVAQRWILARLRDETYFGLAALNTRIAELSDELNARPMKTYGELSRRQLFEQMERDALKPLPEHRFEYAEWKSAKVNIDYHVAYDGHFYSVPHAHAREEVEVRASVSTIEVYLRGKRIAAHKRSAAQGRHTTIAAHMPKAHQKHLQWTPSRLINWAGTIGQSTQRLITLILESRPHPEQGYRSCLGILRLAKTYGHDRLEAACDRAVAVNARSYRHVDSILKHGLDRVPLDEENDAAPPISHRNVRGPKYYQ